MSDPRRVVVLDYTNWRGERRERQIRPLGLHFENNEWHPDTEWLVEAVDMKTGEIRTFALSKIHSWKPAALTASKEMP